MCNLFAFTNPFLLRVTEMKAEYTKKTKQPDYALRATGFRTGAGNRETHWQRKKTKETRESPISLVYSNALTFMNYAFNDALVGRYPSSVLNLRASLEAHLVLEKLLVCNEEEFLAWVNHKDLQNEETFDAYWKVFRPTAISLTEAYDRKHNHDFLWTQP